MLKTGLFLGLISLSYIGLAQNNNKLPPGIVEVTEKNTRSDDVRGTPYLFNEWKDGYLINNVGNRVSGEFMYDLVKNKFLARQQGLLPLALHDKFIDSLFLMNDDERLVFVKMSEEEEIEPGIYQVLYDGKVSFIAKRVKELRKADFKDPYSEGKTFHEYVNEDKYFMKIDKEQFSPIKLKKGSIRRTFKPYRSNIKDYLRQNREVSIKTENGFIKLIKYLEADTNL